MSLLLLLAPAASAQADICPSGCTFSSIKAAVDGVPAGGTGAFTIAAGNYAEPGTIGVTDGRAITLTSTGGGVTVTRAGPGVVFSVQGDPSSPTPPSLTLVGISITAFNDRSLQAVWGDVTLQDCVLYTVGIVDEGGAVRVEHGTLTVEDSVFLDTFATTQGGHLVARDSAVTIRQSLFHAGFARIGGAIALESTDGAPDLVTIEDTRFEDNLAAESGGAIALRGEVNLVLRRSVFLRNAAVAGGAVAQELAGAPGAGLELAIEGSTFESNVALGDGGALAFADAAARIEDSVFLENVATGTGGAAWIGGGATTLRRNLLCANQAAEGGAIATVSPADQAWVNNRFVENEATLAGGAIAHAGGRLTLTHDNLLGNLAPEGGAVVSSGALDLKRNLVAFTGAGPAVSLRAGGTFASAFDAWWQNEAGDVQGGTASETDVHEDPLIARFEAGLACDAVDDFYSWYGPLRDAGAGDGAVVAADHDGTVPDIGAYGGPEADDGPWQDADSDGFVALYDCLEADPSWHPDVDLADGVDVEVWYDGLDQDCDGASDYDQDRDGYDDLRFGGGDCLDTDPAVHPGADEQPGRGDQDCDGIVDADEDGWSPPEDCDDADPRIHPGAVEDPDPEVDRDCVGPADVVRPLVPAQCGTAGGAAALPTLAALCLARKRRRAPVRPPPEVRGRS